METWEKLISEKLMRSNQMGLDLADAKGHDDFMPSQLVIPKGKAVLVENKG